MSFEQQTTTADKVPHDFRVSYGVITLHPTYALKAASGRIYHFEWHKFCGPTFVRRNGEPLKTIPSETHHVWKPFGMWIRQGQRIDAEGHALWGAEYVLALQDDVQMRFCWDGKEIVFQAENHKSLSPQPASDSEASLAVKAWLDAGAVPGTHDVSLWQDPVQERGKGPLEIILR